MSDTTTTPQPEAPETEKPESGLLLDSLEIENFRCFRHLTIPKLGRVNLITGKNNVGKSTLLEAIWIFTIGCPDIAIEILLRNRNNHFKNNNWDCSSLLFNTNIDNFNIHSKNRLLNVRKINDTSVMINSTKNSNTKSRQISTPQGTAISNMIDIFDKETGNLCFYIKQNGVSDFSYLWERIDYTPYEDHIVKSLNILAPDITRAGLKSTPAGTIPVAKVTNKKEAVPLAVFGDGMNRLFGLSVTFANVPDGILLIDEIENGFHYSVLEDVWRLIFETAKMLNVQVFVVSHSKECIEAFQKVSTEDDNPESGMLIRLENRDGDIMATNFDEERLAKVTRQGIEVR